MAIKVAGTTVVDDSRQLTNITAVDATTVSALNSAGIVSDIVADTTPQLGGNLDLNSNNITGTGNVDITGDFINTGNITTTGYIRGPASFTIDPAAHGDDTGTVIIAGNLQVDGTTTTINSTSVAVDDLNLTLASGALNAAAANGAGLTVDGANATLTYVSTTDNWAFNKGLDVTGNITVSGTVDGRDVAADGSKLDGIEAGATADQTAAEILTAIKTVDGAASGLDADLLDGQQGTYYLDANNFTNMPAGYTGWTVSDGTNSESVTDGSSVTFSATGAASVSYNTTTNTLTVGATDTNTTYSAGTGLGLSGTTFNVDVGTTASKIVQLDGSARLPAVDGSQLTNLPSPTPPTSANTVGTYAFAMRNNPTGNDNINVGFGGTTSGSNLRPTSAPYFLYVVTFSSAVFTQSGTMSGTWRCMGYFDWVTPNTSSSFQMQGATLWVRIS